jgi:hypothetical protein
VLHSTDEAFVRFLSGVARDEAPRLFAIVEEHGEREDARVAGYGLAFADRADVNSVEGDFHLNSQSAETALRVFDISTGDEGVRRLHLVWLD